MLVALVVAGLHAGRVDRQLDRRIGAQVQPPAVVAEVALNPRQAPEAPDAELDARSPRVELPAAAERLAGSMVGVGDAHNCLRWSQVSRGCRCLTYLSLAHG